MLRGKSITIVLDNNSLRELRGRGFNLCFAKRLKDQEFNVIWRALNRYDSNNVFCWTPEYQVFGSNRYFVGDEIRTTVKPVDIDMGQKVILDENGQFSAPINSSGNWEALSVENNYGNIHIGVNQVSEINGNRSMDAIYLTPEACVKGNINLTPVDEVMIWFGMEYESMQGNIFSSDAMNSIVVDLNGRSSQTVEYARGRWNRLD